MATKPPRLNAQQAKFVEHYLSGKSQIESAKLAGYTGTAAGGNIMKAAAVQEAIVGARREMVARGVYNLEAAMKEADACIAFARETENANAYAKALELKAKLNGLLIEKHDVRSVGFHVNISGIDENASAIATSSRELTDEEEDVLS